MRAFALSSLSIAVALAVGCNQDNFASNAKTPKAANASKASKPSVTTDDDKKTKLDSDTDKDDKSSKDDPDADLGNSTNPDNDTDDDNGTPDNLNEDDGETQVVDAELAVTRFPDTAADTNCLSVSVNGGAEVSLGCNKGALPPRATIKAKGKPFCNSVRLILYTNGRRNRVTDNPGQIARDFQIAKNGPGVFTVKCNDNGDGDWNDLNLVIDGLGKTSYTIENTPFQCD